MHMTHYHKQGLHQTVDKGYLWGAYGAPYWGVRAPQPLAMGGGPSRVTWAKEAAL